MMLLLISILIAAPAAILISWCVLRMAGHLNLLDVPGERSLHTAPVPRGGGLAIAVCVLAGAAILHVTGHIAADLAWALGSGGAIVAVLGWQDDRRGAPMWIRAIGYLISAALAVWFNGGLSSISVGSTHIVLGLAGIPLCILGAAWLTNLYNFMDGADGIAAVQGISAGLFAAVMFSAAGDWGAAALCVILAAACAGFLTFNWPPARLFMGDVGSCVLGYSFAVLAIHGEQTGAAPVLAWILLLLIFIMDASLTLMRRMARGEQWYSAHRTHAYQLLVQSGLGHRGLLLRFALINFLVTGPLTLIAYRVNALPALTLMAAIAAISVWYGIQRRYGAA